MERCTKQVVFETGTKPASRSDNSCSALEMSSSSSRSSGRRQSLTVAIQMSPRQKRPFPLRGRSVERGEQGPPRSGRTVLLSVLGLTPGRSVWGLEPWDMQLFVRFFFPTFGTKDRDDVESEEVQKQVHTTNGGVESTRLSTRVLSTLEKHVHDQLGGGAAHDAGTGETVEKKPFYRVPMRRHMWGCEQYELHASWGDLFLDLACEHASICACAIVLLRDTTHGACEIGRRGRGLPFGRRGQAELLLLRGRLLRRRRHWQHRQHWRRRRRRRRQ